MNSKPQRPNWADSESDLESVRSESKNDIEFGNALVAIGCVGVFTIAVSILAIVLTLMR